MNANDRLAKRMTRALAAACALLLPGLMCVSCGGAGKALSERTMMALDVVLESGLQQHGVPGALAGAWIEGDGSWVARGGRANIESGEVPQAADKVRIGSITRTFVATVILQLVEEGKLSLDDRLSKWEQRVPGSENITVRMLLNNTSGLFSYTDAPEFWGRLFSEPTKAWTPGELVDIAVAHPPVFAPGEGYRNSGTDYILLGMILEKVSGGKASREIKKRVCDRLELQNTYLPEKPDLPAPRMNGYMPDPSSPDRGSSDLINITTLTPYAWTDGGMVSTIDDLKVWAKANAEGELISATMQKERLALVPSGDPQYGLGIVVTASGYLGHSGALPGYNCSMYYHPRQKITVIVLLNRYPGGAEGMSDEITGQIVKTLRGKAAPD